MKKIFSYSLLAVSALALGACANEEADIFDQSAAERLNGAKATFTDRLTSSPNGWIFEYFGSTETNADNYIKDLGYLMMINLKKDGSVIAGMKNYHTDNKYVESESLWEVITDMSAVLSFNSYSPVIHLFSEPENFKGSTSYGGDTGKGMLGDYEFVILDSDAESDHIMLKGKKHGGYSRLTKITTDESFEQYITEVSAKQSELLSNQAPNHLIMNVGDKQYYFIMPNKGGELGLTKLWPAGTDSTFTMVLNPLIMTRQSVGGESKYVVRFRDRILGNDEETVAQEFFFNPETNTFYSENENINIVGEEPYYFFFEKYAESARFTISRSSDGSDKAKDIVSALASAYSGIKYTFQNVQLQREDDNNAILTVSYRTNKNASGKASYRYAFSRENNNFKLSYKEPVNSSSETQYKNLPALVDFCNAFSGTFSLAVGSHPLNLSTIKFQKVDDASFSIIPTYTK